MAEIEDTTKTETASAKEQGLVESAGDKWWWVVTVGILLWIGFVSVAVLIYLWRH